MISEAVKLEREKHQTAAMGYYTDLAKSLLTNPLVLGFSAALVNHAVYKTGWYESDITIPNGGLFGIFGGDISPGEAAANVHDSIFMMIAIATVLGSLKGTDIPDIIGNLNPLNMLK